MRWFTHMLKLRNLCIIYSIFAALLWHTSHSFYTQAFSVFFVCVAFTSDIICLLFIPVQWLFFAASTYVWVQYVWHTGQSRFYSMPANSHLYCKHQRTKFQWLNFRSADYLLWSTCMQREESVCLLCPCGSCLCTLKPPYGSKIWRTFMLTSVGLLLPTGKCQDNC